MRPYRTVCIVGGGTAGYLTALALRAKLPALEITLVESEEIGIIGVGEATTPLTVKFLHNFLDIDPDELFRAVDVTWKLGIRFEWGRPGKHFNYAFDTGRLLEPLRYSGDLNAYSLGSMLMSTNRVPILRDGPRVGSLLDRVALAYHLDNEKFVAYLRQRALSRGVKRRVHTITEVRVTSGGNEVAGLGLDDGSELQADLYVDCSGFRSALLEGALKSPFVPYGSSLFTDSAITANVPHGGVIKPYTVAETMEAGWCWNIPTVDSDHRGYVFASEHMTPEDAEAEMRAKNPGMGDVQRLVRFRVGRHEHFWKGNVVAVGNAYGFVEPLESTGIHMIIHEINQLVLNFPASREDTALKAAVNRKLNAHWDEIRWFLSVHYRFNHRSTSKFWRRCNAEVDISGAEERIGVFKERAPLTYRQSLFWTPEQIFTDFAYDIVLMGQDVPARFVDLEEPRASWRQRYEAQAAVVAQAVPQAEAIALLGESSHGFLRRMVSAEGTWAAWP